MSSETRAAVHAIACLCFRLERLRPAVALSFALACLIAQAEPSVPWTPDAYGRHCLELLVDEAGLDLPLTQWPLPTAAVAHALDALPLALPTQLDAARAHVRSQLRVQDASRLSLTLRSRSEVLSGFGDDATPGSSVTLRSSVLASEFAALQVGGRIEAVAQPGQAGSQFRLDDSAVATAVLGVQFQAWSHRNWWSPGWQSSLPLGNNAPAFNGIGVQRASASTSVSPWLGWLGPWNAEFFVAQAEDRNRSYLVGNRITLRPFSNLEIGLTRTAQWGGTGHQQSLKSFLRMLVGAGVNADTARQQGADPANELAGFDLRWRCPAGVRCAAYTQLIGEDQAGLLPSKYLGLYGVEGWSSDGTQRYFAEYAETTCGAPLHRGPERGCAYRNYAYPEGYTSAGRWIGASVGPDSRLLTLGLIDAELGASLRLHAGAVGSRIGTYSPLTDDPRSSGRLIAVAARQSFQWGPAAITAELDWLRVHAADGDLTEARLGANIRMGLDDAYRSSAGMLGSSLSGRDGDRLTPLLVGAGLIAGSALLDRPLDDYARAHGDNPSSKALHRVGNAVPIAGMGLAGLSWFAQRGTVQGDVAFSAVGAGLSAFAVTELSKLAIGRARPTAELGPGSFGHLRKRDEGSFPSAHTAVAWAVVTPYAQHYDLPWLYGIAALTNVARVMGRDHWLSDTVAGSALGYWMGGLFYRHAVASTDRSVPMLLITPHRLVLDLPFE